MATVLSRSNHRPSLMDQVRQLEREEAKTPREQKPEPEPEVKTAKPPRVLGGKTKGNK
jgi:hypothetical protein